MFIQLHLQMNQCSLLFRLHSVFSNSQYSQRRHYVQLGEQFPAVLPQNIPDLLFISQSFSFKIGTIIELNLLFRRQQEQQQIYICGTVTLCVRYILYFLFIDPHTRSRFSTYPHYVSDRVQLHFQQRNCSLFSKFLSSFQSIRFRYVSNSK